MAKACYRRVAERGMKRAALGEKDSSVHGNGSSVLQQVFKAGESAFAWMDLCLSEIKSGHSDGVSKKRRIVKSCRSSFTSLARRK